jgi:ParB family chromosome partitioning protein
MTELIEIEIALIRVGLRKRAIGEIERLAESIQEHGLLHPIGVRTLDRDGAKLIYGERRLEAAKLLGWQMIPALTYSVSDLDAEIMEIDENLHRQNLTALERAEHLVRRKEIYEAMLPETKAGAIGPYRQMTGDRIPSFVESAAENIGISRRAVSDYVMIGHNLATTTKEIVQGTPVEDNAQALRELARIPKREQEPAARALVAGRIKSRDLIQQRAGKVLIPEITPIGGLDDSLLKKLETITPTESVILIRRLLDRFGRTLESKVAEELDARARRRSHER